MNLGLIQRWLRVLERKFGNELWVCECKVIPCRFLLICLSIGCGIDIEHLVLAIWYIILKDNFKLSELEGLMQYKDVETIECAIEWAILIDSLTLCRNILLGLATAFTCDVEAELLEIEIMFIDEIEKQKQSRKKHYYNGQSFLLFTITVI